LGGVTTTQRREAVNEQDSDSSASAPRRFFSQIDRLFEGSTADRQRALELLKASEPQVTYIV